MYIYYYILNIKYILCNTHNWFYLIKNGNLLQYFFFSSVVMYI